MKIVVADDSRIIRMIVIDLLKNYFVDPEIYEAKDGKEAIDIVTSSTIDLLLCDLNMPECDGIQVLDTLKPDKRYRQVKIIMITAEASKEKIMSIAKKGVNGYVVKPIGQTNLFHALDRAYRLQFSQGSDKKALNVLIADDSKAIRKLLRTIVNDFLENTVCIEAEDGAEALQHANNIPVHLLLLDWNMPKKNGAEVIMAFRNNQVAQHMKIVIVSGAEVKKLLPHELRHMVNGFVKKPFDATSLMHVVTPLVKRIR